MSIKSVPDEIIERIKKRAARNHRSLQGELMVILEEAVGLKSDLTPEEVLKELAQDDWRTEADSADVVRKDRDAG